MPWSIDDLSPQDDLNQPRRMSKRRLWTFRLIALGIPAIIGAIVVWNRVPPQLLDPDAPIYFNSPDHEESGMRSMFHPVYGWVNVSNQEGMTYGSPVRINSRGFRDRDYTVEKPTDVKRILVLGDSYAWGYGVAIDDIFTEILEAELEKTQQKWEVINTGVCGWGTDQEYLFLTREGFKYKPDIVVLTFFLGNDPINNASAHEYGLHKPVFVDDNMTLENVPVPKPSDHVGPLIVQTIPVHISAVIIDSMHQKCEQAGAKLVIMKFGAFLDDKWKPHDGPLLEEFSRFPNWNLLDLDREFEKLKISRTSVLEGNYRHHWNAYGHRRVAESLHGFLLEKRWVEPAVAESR